MIVVLPVCPKDFSAALQLLRWIADLGPNQNRDLMLILDAALSWREAKELADAGDESFRMVSAYSPDTPMTGWPRAANQMFFFAAKKVEETCKQPFLWLEPDAIPLKRGWLDALQAEYSMAASAFMGCVMENDSHPQLPSRYLAGVAVYPPNAYTLLKEFQFHPLAWDISTAEKVLPLASHTRLIHNFWGQPDLAPTFLSERRSGCPVNTFTLEDIRPMSVIFHRNKDGSLIRLLAEKLGIRKTSTELAVCFPFCDKDAPLMALSLQWMVEMKCKFNRTCVLHYDSSVNHAILQIIRKSAEACFAKVELSRYLTPNAPYVGWPAAPNYAFMKACEYMGSHFQSSWFWFEADAVAISPKWLDILETEYAYCQKPFMGTVFPNRTHMNGVGIYPADMLVRVPKVREMVKEAWDFKLGPLIAPHAHEANRLIQHNNNAFDRGPASFTPSTFRFINPSTVVYHPVKNDSLIQLLRKRRA